MSADLRPGREEDLPQLLAIYNQSVSQGHATFDESEATIADRRARFDSYAVTGPYRLLVAADGARVLGYATSSPYRPHPAFQETVETSIYLRPEAVGRGLGGWLYDELLAALADGSVRRVVAAVALHNDASVALHLSGGFTVVGTFTDYVVKHGRRISSTWFERPVAFRPGPGG